jgi:hypothetical protein
MIWRRKTFDYCPWCAPAMLPGISYCPSRAFHGNKNGKMATKMHHRKTYGDTIMFMRLETAFFVPIFLDVTDMKNDLTEYLFILRAYFSVATAQVPGRLQYIMYLQFNRAVGVFRARTRNQATRCQCQVPSSMTHYQQEQIYWLSTLSFSFTWTLSSRRTR